VSPRGGRALDSATELPRPRTVATPPYWLVLAAFLVVLPFLGKAPVIDEEGYLWIAAHLDPLRPYDWVRAWPPYAGDAYGCAHPPLHLYWLKLCEAVASGPVLRAFAGLPWVALLAYSVARLTTRACHHPGIAAAIWLASPIVVLALHDSWMIDLPAVALATFAVAAYREGLVDEDERWFVASGLALGLAIETKYTMGALVPVFVVHMLRLGPRPRLWLALAAVVLAVELPLWAAYGRPHPWEVWVHRGEIASGTLAGRTLGTIARCSLLALPLVLFRARPALLAAGLGLALLAVIGARPSEMPVATSVSLVLLAGLGGAVLARAVEAVLKSPAKRRKGDRGDPLLLGGWILATVLGVIVFHNYASARYLLPAAAPAAILLTRSGEEVPWGKALLRVTAGVTAVVALVLAVADYRYAAATVEVAEAAVGRAPEPGQFAGEWGFRGVMEAAGWARYRPDVPPPPGTWVVVAKNASPGTVDLDALEPYDHVASADIFPVRVVDLAVGIGLYAETLGPLPFGLGRGPLESATLYRARGGAAGGVAGPGALGAGAGDAVPVTDGAAVP